MKFKEIKYICQFVPDNIIHTAKNGSDLKLTACFVVFSSSTVAFQRDLWLSYKSILNMDNYL